MAALQATVLCSNFVCVGWDFSVQNQGLSITKIKKRDNVTYQAKHFNAMVQTAAQQSAGETDPQPVEFHSPPRTT
jgi:hypothetical protein